MITLSFPDGTEKQFVEGTSGAEVAQSISEGLARVAVAAKVDGMLTDLTTPLTTNSSIEIITTKSPESLPILRHTTAHVFAQALLRLHPEAKITIGPPTEQGFFYDVDCDALSDEKLPAIEAEMTKIIKEDLSLEKVYKSESEAREFFKDNAYKLEIIDALTGDSLREEEAAEGDLENGKLQFYRQGEFEDLCKGPHLPRTGMIKAFALEKITKAYWRGNAENKQLNRVYGTAFWKKTDLDEHYRFLEEAKQRDHRLIGKQMELFMHHEYSAGSAFFLPKGYSLYLSLQNFIREEYQKRGYQEVMTPNLFNKKLWETSGHWEHYSDDMFTLEVEGHEYALKPMNCPSHCLIFKNQFRSYRELPLRIADFGALHRNELSGALSGLTRVRKFCQDDAHIFCTLEQVEEEINGMIQFAEYVYKDVFDMEYAIELSTRPEDSSLGTKEMWDQAEDALANAIKKNGKDYQLNPGDGAFYGPKIDFKIKDCLGRYHQTATIQLDFNLPERFDLKYEGSDNQQHRPVMVHRAVLGSIERFMAVMIEHFAGKFPLWLSPVQVKLLNVADRHVEYCEQIREQLTTKGFRVETNYDHMTINNKIRLAQSERVNYIVVLGDKDQENHTVSVRDRNNDTHVMKPDEFLSQLEEERDSKEIR